MFSDQRSLNEARLTKRHGSVAETIVSSDHRRAVLIQSKVRIQIMFCENVNLHERSGLVLEMLCMSITVYHGDIFPVHSKFKINLFSEFLIFFGLH